MCNRLQPVELGLLGPGQGRTGELDARVWLACLLACWDGAKKKGEETNLKGRK